MKGRPKRVRKILSKPVISGFKPYGSKGSKVEPVFLQYEEYEAMRLCDYMNMNQVDASAQMEISRPTLTRIYMESRQKVAKAFVEGRPIVIEGGKVEMKDGWYSCSCCHALFNNSCLNDGLSCPVCGNKEVESYRED